MFNEVRLDTVNVNASIIYRMPGLNCAGMINSSDNAIVFQSTETTVYCIMLKLLFLFSMINNTYSDIYIKP